MARSPSTDLQRRRLFASIAITCVAILAVLAFIGYRDLDGKVEDLERTVASADKVQSKANDDVRSLTAAQNKLADQLVATQNKLNEHPAASKIAKQSQPSVFTVLAGDWLGSGFVASSGSQTSQLLTNYHVVEDLYTTGSRQVTVRRGDTSYDGKIVDVSEADDLAVIEVDHVLPALQMNSKHAASGDPVLVLGSPNGLAGTLTSGIVSAYRTLEHVSYLQFTAPISPGNSGGPVLNETGQVLGVTVMKDVRDGTEGIGYAIPTDRVCESLDVC